MLMCVADTCFAALGDDLLRGHYLYQGKGVWRKDDSYSHSIMKYSNVITYKKKESVVLLTELQGNYNHIRKPTKLVTKHKMRIFVVSIRTFCPGVHVCRFPTYYQ